MLDFEAGILQYFVSEQSKHQKPRGALSLSGATVSLSDEAPHMLVVCATNGEMYKLRGMCTPGKLADGPLGLTGNMVMAVWCFRFLKITFNSLPYLRTLVTDTACPPLEVGRGAEIRKYLSTLTKELRTNAR